MYPVLFSLYGPIAINTYGLFISLGVTAFVFCVQRDITCIKNNIDKNIIQIVYIGCFGAFFGGKIIHYTLEPVSSIDWLDIVFPWRGGFSILGSVAGACGTLLFYFSRTKSGILVSFDCIAPYIPLLQSIGRIGCFFAGCCYGKPCVTTWIIPIDRHPVQLYSAFFLAIIFFYLLKEKNKPYIGHGNIAIKYGILITIERFIIDYWRDEQTFPLFQSTLSHNQWFAVLLFLLSILASVFLNFYYKQKLNRATTMSFDSFLKNKR